MYVKTREMKPLFDLFQILLIHKNYSTVDLNDEIQVTQLSDINSKLASLYQIRK